MTKEPQGLVPILDLRLVVGLEPLMPLLDARDPLVVLLVRLRVEGYALEIRGARVTPETFGVEALAGGAEDAAAYGEGALSAEGGRAAS